MHAESAGQTMLNGKPITSAAGAMGLMQVMPKTYAAMRARYGLGPDPYDPHDNILAGTAYLHELYERYGYPALFAAYNAGPSALDNFIAGGVPLPAETLGYLAALSPAMRNSVLARYSSKPPVITEQGASAALPSAEIPLSPSLFFSRGTALAPGESVLLRLDSTSRFAVRSDSIFVSYDRRTSANPAVTADGLLVPLGRIP
jgi:hypothetical protein